MLGSAPADLPADLVTEYTSGPFSEILTGDAAGLAFQIA